MDGLPVFAFQNTRLRRTIFHNGIRHFKRNVALVTDRDREIHCALLDLRGHEGRIGRAAVRGFQPHGAAVRAHSRPVEVGACDLRVLCAPTSQTELIQKLTVIDLVMLDGQRRALVRIAENVLRRDGLFVPCKLQLEIETILIRYDERIADGLPQHLGGHGEIIGFRVLAVCGGHLDLAGFRERSAFAVRRPVFRHADRCIIRVFAEELQRVCEISVCQRVALDRAIDRAVGRAGGLTVGLPCKLQIEVNAAFQPQNEREIHVCLHGFALLVLLYGMGLHGQDIVLKLRAVRQRHVQHTACIRFL